ncbi:MAG: NAD(P)H-dependent oxidoreductase [Eubacteriales bacterium]
MSVQRKIVALLGSTRINSSSKSMIEYLEEKFYSHQIEVVIYQAHKIHKNKKMFKSMLEQIIDSELFIICAPVYIDGISFSLTSVLEQIYDTEDRKHLGRKKCMAIIHSGFPETQHREAGIEICHCFSETMEFDWQGGFGFGISSIVEGKSLNENRKMTKWIRKTLDITAEAIIKGEKIPSTAFDLSMKLPIPIPIKWLPYILNFVMRRKAKADGVTDIYARPYVN